MPTTLSIPQYTSLYLTRFANKSIPIAQQVFRDEFIQAVEQHIGVHGSVSELWSAVQSNFSTAYTDISNRRAGHLLFWSNDTDEGVGIVLPDTSKMRVLDPTATTALPTVGVAGKSFLGGVDVGEIVKSENNGINYEPDINLALQRFYNPNRIDSLIPLLNNNGQNMLFDSDEINAGMPIFIYPGCQLLKLNEKNGKVRIYTWFLGRYREGWVELRNLRIIDLIQDYGYSKEVFVNDVERCIYDAIDYHSNNGDIYDYELDADILLTRAQTFLNDVKSGTLTISRSVLNDVQTELLSYMHNQNRNNVEILNFALACIYGEQDPVIMNGLKHSEITLVPPFTKDWFSTYAPTYDLERAANDDFFTNSGSGTILNFENPNTPDANNARFIALTNELQALKNDIQQGIINPSPETLWLSQKDLFDLSSSVYNRWAMVYLDQTMWHISPYNKRAAEVSCNHSFGTLYLSPLITVLIHEFNMCTAEQVNYNNQGRKHKFWGLSDTHIPADMSPESSRLAYIKGNLTQADVRIRTSLAPYISHSDLLFHTHPYLNLYALNIFITKILNNQ